VFVSAGKLLSKGFDAWLRPSTLPESNLPLGFARLRLDGGNRDSVDDILRFATARKIIRRPIEPLQNRTDGGRTGKSLCQFVADVASLEVRKDEHVGVTGNA